jgi:hypothetical protein
MGRGRKRQREDLTPSQNDEELAVASAWTKKECKKGPFSKAESQAVLDAFEQCRLRHQVSVDTILEEDGRKSNARGLWVDLAATFPGRNLHALYNHVIRKLQPTNDGKWSAEEVETMKQLVAEHGPKWVVIGATLKRAPDAVRRKYGRICGDFSSGHWNGEEEAALIKLVYRSVRKRQKTGAASDKEDEEIDVAALPADGHPWKRIAKKLGTRSASQCSDKWKCLRLRAGKGKGRQQSRRETYEFLKRVEKEGADSPDKVSWRSLGYPKAERRWLQLRKTVREDMSFKEALKDLLERFNDDDDESEGEVEATKPKASIGV